jgi:probable HAF family extracellular repeat protein
VNATTGTPTQHPFLWQDGKMKDLGTIGGTLVLGVNHLNDRGEVVGAMFTEGDQTFHPFLWNGHAMIDLGTFGGDFGSANRVNEAGDVVGFAAMKNGAYFAFLRENGVMANLGAVDGDPCSVAFDINSRKQVVGASESCDGTFVHAFLWEDGHIIDLNTFVPPGSGVRLTAAAAINDQGEIAAQGMLSNGGVHAFLLIPCDGDDGANDKCLKENGPATAIKHDQVTQPDLTPAEIRARLRTLLSNRAHRRQS